LKNASHWGGNTRRGTTAFASAPTDSPLPAFTIEAFERVEYGSKRAVFKVTLPHVVLDAEFFMPDGKPAFVQPGSVRAKYDGQYHRTARFSDELGAALLEEALRLFDEEGA